MNQTNFINRKNFIAGILAFGVFVALATLTPSFADAQMDKVKVSMAALKAKTAKMGPDRKSTRLNSSHPRLSRMPSSA